MEELRHAQASGDPEKIRKKEKKLQEAKNELMEVQAGLNQSLTRQ
ncbi:PF06476 domain protein [Klebsiella sp. OBRC7]|nr:PF06476 domain protein [Klebsiella sp. OBRC7]